MPRGYRLLVAAACGSALFASLGTGAFFGSLYAPGHKQYQAVAGDQPRHSDYAGPSKSLPDISGLPGPVERAIANPHPATGEDHEIRDLAAQEASALWAFWMVVASFASALITTVGTIFLYKQIVLTREAVEDTGLATKAMERQNELSETETKLTLRPYVWFGKMEIRNVVAGGEPELYVDICHAGQTPALKIRTFVSLGLLEPGMEDCKLRFEKLRPGATVARTQMFPAHPGLDGHCKLGKTIDEATIDQLKSGQRSFILAGIASYHDAFGKRHLTTFKSVSRWFIGGGVMSTQACGRGNNAS